MRTYTTKQKFLDWAFDNIEDFGMTTDAMVAEFSQISKYCPSSKTIGHWLKTDNRFTGKRQYSTSRKIWYTNNANINCATGNVNPSTDGFSLEGSF